MQNTTDDARVVLITGAARRIGAATARHLHDLGWRVLLHAHRSQAAAADLAAACNAGRADSARVLLADLLDPLARRALIADALACWGRLDALVNNASTFYPTPVGSTTAADWRDLMGSNLEAPFFLIQDAAPHLARQQGAVVNLIDVHAERPLAGHPVYVAAKAGLAGLTRALAIDLAPEVRVNGVAPGAMLWPEPGPSPADRAAMIANIPLRRMGGATVIAEAIAYLLDAEYITGQVLAVDGGRSVGLL